MLSLSLTLAVLVQKMAALKPQITDINVVIEAKAHIINICAIRTIHPVLYLAVKVPQ